MSKQLKRHIEILCSLPKPPNYTTVASIHSKLANTDHAANKRTIERDLQTLHDIFGTALYVQEGCGEHGRTSHWAFHADKTLLPKSLFNDRDLAMALSLLEQQAKSRLPKSVLDRLAPYWRSANATVEQSAQLQHWKRDFQFLPDPMRPEAPPVSESIQHTVEEALENEQYLTLTLDTLDGEEILERIVPLRLILREEILYLLAECDQAPGQDLGIRLIPLHRATSARAEGLAMGGSGLEPDLAQQHALGLGDTVILEMRVSRKLAGVLFDRPIGRQQIITPDVDNRFLIRTLVEDSPQLRRWLNRRLDELEVIAPFQNEVLRQDTSWA